MLVLVLLHLEKILLPKPKKLRKLQVHNDKSGGICFLSAQTIAAFVATLG